MAFYLPWNKVIDRNPIQVGKIVERKKRISKRALAKSLIFLAFIIFAVCLFRMTPAKSLLTPETLGHVLEETGFWGPLLFVLMFAVSICLFVPASIPAFLGATVFGAHWGFLYGWIGAIAGASGAFFIGRTLGRDFIKTLMGDKLRKYDDAIERNGFATVLYLRLINSPFTFTNFGICLTKIRFWDYFFGTALGVLVGIFVLTFFGGTLKEVWVSGNWGKLVSLKFFFAAGLYIFSFFIPKMIKGIKSQT
jgi:uncharacterized membrane protein YdjX (TVP38/TMEM64 family)